MNNIQRVLLIIGISGCVWFITEPMYSGRLATAPASVWFVMTIAAGFFLFRTNRHFF